MSDSVTFSWEDPQTRRAEQALVVRQRDHNQVVQTFQKKKKEQQEEINQIKLRLDDGQQVVLRERADNRNETDRLRSQRLALENKRALVQRDRDHVSRQEIDLQAREVEAKRNRTPSMIFVEDDFAKLTPKAVVDFLTHANPRVRSHAMNNVAFCINKSGDAVPTFVRFGASEIAPFILPKLDQLISSRKPSDSVKEFSENVVSTRDMAKALAVSGQCPQLANYLVRNNETVSRFAITALRQMMNTDGQVLSAVYVALKEVVPHVPVHDSPCNSRHHPSVAFFAEISPRIVIDCFNNGLWSTVSPLVTHKSDVIRRAVLPRVVSEAASSERVRHGLLEADMLRILEHHYESPQPPMDTVDFFAGLLPHLADMMCRHLDHVLWLISRLNDPSARISAAVIAAFRTTSTTEDPVILNTFVKAELLRRLNETLAQTTAINGLICHLLPILALPHAHAQTCSDIMAFLDHPDDALGDACLAACVMIVDSTIERRNNLYSEFSKLDLTKRSTLQLCDYAMPIFCKDLADAGDFSTISRYLFHPEPRVRIPAHDVWRTVVVGAPQARARIVQNNLLHVIFDLCNSQYEDCVILGSHLLPHMAIEVSKTGQSRTRQLVGLLGHSRMELRKAAMRSVHIIAGGGDINCEVLLEAGTFNTLKLSLRRYPLDDVQVAQQILVSLAPFLAKSYDACCGLLQLLDSTVPEVENAILAVLDRISQATIDHRKTLRNAIVACLQLASDNLVKFAVQAIKEWIGPDFVQLNNFQQLFQLASHHDRRIQNASLYTLKQKMDNREYQKSLEKADIVPFIQSLSGSDNPEAISFVASALRSLALSLAGNGHVSEILHQLSHEESSIQESASAAIITIANGSEAEKQHLLDEDVLERLAGNHERLGLTELRLLSTIIHPLSFEYVHADKTRFILSLVDHRQETISRAAFNSVVEIASGTVAERKKLLDALLPLLGGGSAILLELASNCLEKTLARDLLSSGDYKQVFALLANEEPGIRRPVISKLQYHVQQSGATVRQNLVDAGILHATLQACKYAMDDLVSFIADCILPTLGPFFTQNDGGASVIPLLKHGEGRMRAAAATAIRNGVESRHGNLQNIADARIISNLHSTMEDDAIRDLWCYVVPKIASFLSNQNDINLLIDGLSDPHPAVRRASSEAIGVMAKTSDETRCRLFPALVLQLEGPPAAAIEQISLAVSLSGTEFVSTGNQSLLLWVIENGEPALVVAAVKAVVDVLSNGSTYDRQKLMDADIFNVALRFHKAGSQAHFSLHLLENVIIHLIQFISLNELMERVLYLFDDSNEKLSQTLYTSLVGIASNPGCSAFLELLPLLLDEDRQGKPFVSKLLKQVAPDVVPRLFESRMLGVVVKLLMAESDLVTRAYLQNLHTCLIGATSAEKDLLSGDPRFVPTLGKFLQSRDVTLRRISSEIVGILSEKSPLRSGMLMEEGIGISLAWISKNGGNDVPASLHALRSLYLTAPDHANQLVQDSLPTLCQILEDSQHSVDIYMSALCFLEDIARQSPHHMIIGSGIVGCLVSWLSPQHSVVEPRCKQSVFAICQVIAQNSDPGRKALIDGNILPTLMQLAADTNANSVINACNVLNALAHTGTYRSELLSVGVREAMTRITSPFRKSTLNSKSDRRGAQEAAKKVLLTLKLTQHVTSNAGNLAGASGAGNTFWQSSTMGAQDISTGGLNVSETGEINRNQFRRSFSESYLPARPLPEGVVSGLESQDIRQHGRGNQFGMPPSEPAPVGPDNGIRHRGINDRGRASTNARGVLRRRPPTTGITGGEIGDLPESQMRNPSESDARTPETAWHGDDNLPTGPHRRATIMTPDGIEYVDSEIGDVRQNQVRREPSGSIPQTAWHGDDRVPTGSHRRTTILTTNGIEYVDSDIVNMRQNQTRRDPPGSDARNPQTPWQYNGGVGRTSTTQSGRTGYIGNDMGAGQTRGYEPEMDDRTLPARRSSTMTANGPTGYEVPQSQIRRHGSESDARTPRASWVDDDSVPSSAHRRASTTTTGDWGDGQGGMESRQDDERTTVPPSYRSAPSDRMSSPLQRLPSYRTVAPGGSSSMAGRSGGGKGNMWTVSEE